MIRDGQLRFGPGGLELKDLYLLELHQLGATVQPVLGYYPEPLSAAANCSVWDQTKATDGPGEDLTWGTPSRNTEALAVANWFVRSRDNLSLCRDLPNSYNLPQIQL